jgi:polyisoprenoid-binding protein YceI
LLGLTDAVVPAGTWSVDPVHSAVAFEVRDMEALIATVAGRFLEFEGSLVGGPHASAEGVIQAASINTGEPERDQDLRSANFFDVERHPQILFRSEEISAVDDGKFKAGGVLEIQGRQHPVTLRGEVLGTGRDRHGAERVALEGVGELEWAGNQIRIRVQVSAQRV